GCVLVGQGVEVRHDSAEKAPGAGALRIHRCAFAGDRAVAVRVNWKLSDVLDAATVPGLKTDLQDSILDTTRLVVLRPTRDPRLRAEAAAVLLPYLLRWRDRGCLLAPGADPVGLIHNNKMTALLAVCTLDDWNRVWGRKAADSQWRAPRYQAGDKPLREGGPL